MIAGDAPVAPPLPSMVMKSGPANTQYSKSFSIFPAAILIPTGLPSLRSRSSSTSFFKSSFVLIPGNFEGLITSCPMGLLRTAAISAVTLLPGKWPPIPGFVPWPIFISMASLVFRFSSVTLYKLGTYSNMYLWAAAFSSGKIPPSPLHMAVPAIALPFASAVFDSFESAPKDMWEIYTGISITMGFFACFPITVFKDTSACSSNGGGLSCAPSTRMSSQPGIFICVPIASIADFPVTAISWISFI